MRVFIPLVRGDGDIHNMWNPYVYTLTDYLEKEHPGIEFCYNVELFETEEVFSFDIVHIMWPSVFYFMQSSSLYRDRLISVKHRNIKVVSTCHNLYSQYIEDNKKKQFYTFTYQESDVIIHLGQFSKKLFEKEYPDIKHIVIPHHVYDTVYTKIFKEKSFVKRYIACLGAFRDEEEVNLLKEAGKALLFTRYFILAPSLMLNAQWSRRNKLALILPFVKMLWLRWRYHIITYDKKWVEHECLLRYMNLSCISFIPRSVNLNSGNITLGFLFRNVVIGPDIGNIGEILREFDNPIFNPQDKESIKSAIYQAIFQQKSGKGMENQKYALKHWATHIIAEKHFDVYLRLYTCC